MGSRKMTGSQKKAQLVEEINYGSVVDDFLEEAEEDAEETAEVDPDESQDDEASSDEDDDDSSGAGEDNFEDDSDGDMKEDDDQVNMADRIQIRPSNSAEPCSFDLRNLLALNGHQLDTKRLYPTNQKKKTSKVTIDLTSVSPDEQFLLEKARDGCTQLVEALWQLPTTKSDVGPMAALPSYDESNIPRAMPLPEPKKETKWEKFAKERGIPLNKNKRSQKVFDEATGEWMYRHGYKKANSSDKEWPIMEVKDNQDPYEDPWERMRQQKKVKTDKNLESELRNKERAGLIAKGTATRVIKSREKERKNGRIGGILDRDNVPVGIPIDMKDGGGASGAKRGMNSTQHALLASQRSTASMGRYDKPVEGEPERKKALSKSKKRKFENAADKNALKNEADRSLKVLKKVIDGGGAEREKAIKKGKFSKGETAYDYEFDDGLGASSFRKKKGRAGAGKAKKMTKKRIV